MVPKQPYPNDENLGVFARIVDFSTKSWLLKYPIQVLANVFFAISPSVPSTFFDSLRAKPTRRALWWGYSLTFLFSFVVVAFWSLVDGTFSGSDKGRIYFSHDLTNIIEYAFLCPAYVAISSQLVVLLV